MNYIQFINEKLSVGAITDLVSANTCGAISVFMGTTRDTFDGKTVLKLEYEAYESMGVKAIEGIANEIRLKWPSVENIAVYHRLGTVPVKEASIVIAISAPHRADAIKATEWCINNVKKSVPIWKKEVYADNESEWKENKESDPNPPKIRKLNLDFVPEIEIPYIPPHLIQIRASKEDVYNRIKKFMERKRSEIDANNIREFCSGNRTHEFTCARVDAILQKPKDSKSHLQVNRVINAYEHRDQINSEYLRKYIPPNGIEERVENLESQLNLHNPVPKNIYKRLKLLEDRMLYLESVSPEYIQFWEKMPNPTKSIKKKIFTISEIDSLIEDLEKKKRLQEKVKS